MQQPGKARYKFRERHRRNLVALFCFQGDKMSINCIICIGNERTGIDLMCDECRRKQRIILNDINSILDASIKICVFTKTHDYPERDSSDFMELTGYLDELEMALRKNKLISNDTFEESEGLNNRGSE